MCLYVLKADKVRTAFIQKLYTGKRTLIIEYMDMQYIIGLGARAWDTR